MKSTVLQPLYALKLILSKKGYLLSFIVIVFLIAFLDYLIPVKTIPGNSLSYQKQLMSMQDYVVVLLISILESTLILMFYYMLKNKQIKIFKISKGNVGIISGLPALLLGLGTCSSMIIPILFGFLGSGFVIFTITNKTWIFYISIIFLLLAIYSLSQKINAFCAKGEGNKKEFKEMRKDLA